MISTVNRSTINHGTCVLFYNRSTKYDNPTLIRHFRRATRDDIANLKKGDVFWLLERPNPGVKASGFTKCQVYGLQGEKIKYLKGPKDGSIIDEKGVYFVSDEAPLLAAIADDPRVTDVLGTATIADRQTRATA
jgi:hypothetical protein